MSSTSANTQGNVSLAVEETENKTEPTPNNNIPEVENQETIMTESQMTTTSCPSYIIEMGVNGKPERVNVNFENILDYGEEKIMTEPNLFTINEMLAKPFHFVNGNVHTHSSNPFRRKSGLLSVISKQGQRSRIMSKTGGLHTMGFVDGKKHKFLKDIFISLIDLHWGWTGLIFTATFFLSWLFFAGLWYAIAYQHGDLEIANQENETYVPCVRNIKDFGSTYLFSIETQHTIGFGGRYPTEECPSAAILMSIQSIVGVIIQAWMAGIIFAKFTIPRNRGQTIYFSKNAVISMRNGVLQLMCRITDLRKYSLLDARVMMMIIQRVETEEGDVIPYQQTELVCGTQPDGTNPSLTIIWPATVSHVINEDSPLYGLKPSELLKSKFEIIVTLIGVTEETGNTIQVRTSYLPNEILWGHRFDNDVMKYDHEHMVYRVNHNKLNHTVNDNTPRKSSKYLDAVKMGVIWSEHGSRCTSRAQSTYRLDFDKIKRM